MAHDVREACNAYKQDESCHNALDLTLGIVVTKTHSRQSRKCEIHNDNQVLPVGFFSEAVFIVEGELRFYSIQVSRVLCDDVPESSKEIAEDQDEEDESEDTEDVHEVDLVHDFVVVFRHRLHSRVLFNTVVQTPTVKFFEQALELLSIQQEKDFVQAEQAQKIQQVQLILVPCVLKQLFERIM